MTLVARAAAVEVCSAVVCAAFSYHAQQHRTGTTVSLSVHLCAFRNMVLIQVLASAWNLPIPLGTGSKALLHDSMKQLSVRDKKGTRGNIFSHILMHSRWICQSTLKADAWGRLNEVCMFPEGAAGGKHQSELCSLYLVCEKHLTSLFLRAYHLFDIRPVSHAQRLVLK